MSTIQVKQVAGQLVNNPQFLMQLAKHIKQCSGDAQQDPQNLTFAFEKAARYPWTVCEANMPIEGQKAVEDISDLIVGLVNNSLHHVMSRQLLNLSQEIITIRDQMTLFMLNQEVSHHKLKEELKGQLDVIRKKAVLQSSAHQKEPYFRPNRDTLSSSTYTTLDNHNPQLKLQIEGLKQEIQKLKKTPITSKTSEPTENSDKIIYLEQKIQSQISEMKIKIQTVKCKTEKEMAILSKKVDQNSNKQFISCEVKRAIKSHLKVYQEEIQICKKDRHSLHQVLTKTQKDMQEYLAGQLKPLWMIIQTLTKQQEELEEVITSKQSFLVIQ